MITRQGSGPANSAMKSNSSRPSERIEQPLGDASTCGRIACIDRALKTLPGQPAQPRVLAAGP
jgi:hypothetical protein